MEVHRSFYRPSHRFRDQVSMAYSSIRRVVELAYPHDLEPQLDCRFGYESGSADISNMLIVYIWTLFEAYMNQAYAAIHDGEIPSDVRSEYTGWGQMRNWLIEKGMFNEDLSRFDELLGEFCARRNCLVHNNGIVDEQYVNQVRAYGGESAFSIGDMILTDWAYHKKLEFELVNSFNLSLEAEVQLFPRDSNP